MSSEPGCAHATADRHHRVCIHILEAPESPGFAYIRRFTGKGLEYELMCGSCSGLGADADPFLRGVCAACFERVDDDGAWPMVSGRPETLMRPSAMRYGHQFVEVPLLAEETIIDLRPLDELPGNLWVALTKSGRLAAVDLATGEASFVATVAESGLDLDKRMSLRLSPDGRYGAVVNVYGRHGVVLDLQSGSVLRELVREDNCCGITPFPIAFATSAGKTLLVHATRWNKLDVSEAATGGLLTDRPTLSRVGTRTEPEHYLDHWFGELSLSPDGERLASFGWNWHPVGVIATWSLRRWLEENVWESEDGPSKVEFLHVPYLWNVPYCWIDGRRIAVWGYSFDADSMVPAVRLFDAVTGDLLRWFAGPDVAPDDRAHQVAENWMPLVFDRFLFSVSKSTGTAIWDVGTGERLHHDVEFRPDGYHRGSKRFVTNYGRGRFRVSRLVE